MLARERPMALFIDEVTYLMAVNSSFIGIFQKAWDQWLSKSNVMIALSGSQMGLMKRDLLSYKAPLFGRASVQVMLPPLPFGVTKQYFPNYDEFDRAAIYAIWGGIPAYWERLDPEISVLDNLREQLLPSNAWMLDEPRLLLQDFITDLYNYVGIMRAIAHGEHVLSAIGKRSGLSRGHTSKYLSILRDTEFVERRVPVTERGTDSRRGRYYINDPYLSFYFRFLAAYQSKLALGQQQQLLSVIEKSLPRFIEANVWQELCREWLLLASAQEQLPLPIEHVGSEWKRTHAFDVVGISEENKSLILGGCYWNDEPINIDVIIDMVRRTPTIIPKNEEWQVYYVGFASGGWKADVFDQTEKIIEDLREDGRRKWQCVASSS